MSCNPHEYTIRDLEVTASERFKHRLRDSGKDILMPGMAGDAFWMTVFEVLEDHGAVGHDSSGQRHVSWITLEHGCNPRIDLVVKANVYVDRRRANHALMEADIQQRIKNLLEGKDLTGMNMTASLVVVERDQIEAQPIELT